MSIFDLILISLIVIGSKPYSIESASPKTTEFLNIVNYEDCEGKDSGNYMRVAQYIRDANCTRILSNKATNFISHNQKGDKSIIGIQVLANAYYTAGAFGQIESLALATSGPLEGKYLYEKQLQIRVQYLKGCSSVLGYSYVTKKSAVLLISDILDPNVLISSTGGFDTFQKSSTTKCKGKGYVVKVD